MKRFDWKRHLESHGDLIALQSENEVLKYAELFLSLPEIPESLLNENHIAVELDNDLASIQRLLAVWNAGKIAQPIPKQSHGMRNTWRLDGTVEKSGHSGRNYPDFGAGLVLSSSGSTGKSKEVLYDVSLLFAKYSRLRAKLKTKLVFPLFHLAGIETLISTLMPGGSIYHAEGIWPKEIDFISCTPSYLRFLLLEHGARPFVHLRFINLGGERTRDEDIRLFKELLPKTKLLQAFGSTESGNLRTRTKEGTQYFKPGEEGADFEVIEGRLHVRKNDSVLLVNGQTPGEWINTGDEVETNSDGFLRIVGRSEKGIFVGGEKVSADEVENCLLGHGEIRDARVYAEENVLLGQIVVAEYSSERALAREELIRFCRNSLREHELPMKFHWKERIELNSQLKGHA